MQGVKSFLKPQSQSGMTLLGMLLLGGLLVFWVLFIVKLVPVYIEGYGVKSIFKKLQETSAQEAKTKRDIEAFMSRNMQTNNIRSVSEKQVVIEQKKETMEVSLDYDVEEPLIANIYIKVKFKNAVSLPRNLDL